MNFSSPAKINLSLAVLKKRDDGFHDIKTEFQFLDWGDTISIEKDKKKTITVNNLKIPKEQNLAHKALILLEKETQRDLDCRITINKNIPIGSGLGGASSNAATLILSLNKLYNLNRTENELLKIGEKLGADIPFFLKGYASEAQGKGEILTVKRFKEDKILLLLPDCKILTKKAFEAIDKTNLPFNWQRKKNSFENWVLDNFEEVKICYKWLGKFAKPRISGTGSSIYVNIKSFEEGKEIMDNAPKKFKYVITKTLNQSPLLNELLNTGV